MKIKSIFLLISLVVLSSCSAIRLRALTPITGSPVPDGLTAKEVESAIIMSGSASGWLIAPSKKSKSTLIGKLIVRQHMVEVAIPYSAKKYSFKYLDSQNMYYNPGEMKIHKKYATWVMNLRKEIYMNLVRKANE